MDLRDYDPAIARWLNIDPVTHHGQSTYNAFDANPVSIADPSGADGMVYGMAGQSAWSNPFPRGHATFGNGVGMNVARQRGNYDGNTFARNSLVFWGSDAMLFEQSYEGHLAREAGSNLYSVEANGVVYLPEVMVGSDSSSWAAAIEQHVYENSPYYNNGIVNGNLSGMAISAGLTSIAGDISYAAAEEVLKGKSFRVFNKNGTNFSPKIYETGWKGGSAGNIKTYSLNTASKAIGLTSKGIGFYGIGTSVYYTANGTYSPTEGAIETTFGFIGVYGGWPGALISASYELGKLIGPSRW